MLQELDIENYAVADRLRVRFRPGLNLLTGETGSGKSIVVDALSLLLGARATAEVVRAGRPRARIAGVFEMAETPELLRWLSETDLEPEQEGELIIEREVLDSGKSRAYVNGRFVTLRVLRELAPLLGDIHGQHEQQSLFSSRTQLEMLDAFAGTAEAASRIGEVHQRWRSCEKRLAELRGNEKERLRLLDLYSFQRREIEEARIEAGEGGLLEQQQRVLQNLERVQQAAVTAYEALYDSSASASAQLKAARQALGELVSYEPELARLAEGLESARAQVQDASFELQSYLDRLEPDPERLAQIEDRLALLEKLKRKYGATLEDVLAYGEEVRRKLEELQSSDRMIAEVEKDRQAAAQEYESLAASLSDRRRKAAAQLQKRVEKELSSLAMERAQFRIALEPAEPGPAGWTASGIDRAGFLVSANPGQPPRPLAQVASGGELSRITLALKTCLLSSFVSPKKKQPPRTLVFDEIDSGVGGRVAEALGKRLKNLAQSHQVLCVTHLPQIAGFADAHYFVEKRGSEDETFTSVIELSPSQRVEELARMLSGEKVTTTAVEHAKQMLAKNA